MTDKEILDQFNQTSQDNITLDYGKWSAQRRQAKLSDSHELWQREHDSVLARWQSDNAAVRRVYLDGLKAAKAEKRAEHDAEIDIQLQPEKKRLQNEWLANNPDETPATFERKAWHLLRENLIEQRQSESFQAELKAQLSTGRYSL
jgi:hypothetical protein